jgi:hypothetical protein
MTKILILTLATLSLAIAAVGDVIAPGQLANPDTLTPNGAIVFFLSGVIATPTFIANYQEQVYSDPFNTFCSGCLDFVFELENTGPDVNGSITVSGYTGSKTDVGFDPTTSGVAPLLVERSSDGSVVGFLYPGADTLKPTESTRLLVVETNARTFVQSFISDQDSTAGFGDAVGPQEPQQPTDETATLFLLGTGILMAATRFSHKEV